MNGVYGSQKKVLDLLKMQSSIRSPKQPMALCATVSQKYNQPLLGVRTGLPRILSIYYLSLAQGREVQRYNEVAAAHSPRKSLRKGRSRPQLHRPQAHSPFPRGRAKPACMRLRMEVHVEVRRQPWVLTFPMSFEILLSLSPISQQTNREQRQLLMYLAQFSCEFWDSRRSSCLHSTFSHWAEPQTVSWDFLVLFFVCLKKSKGFFPM